MTLYDYQQDLVTQGFEILKEKKLLLLSLEMRVGKTPISLTLANMYKAKAVLFVTKKKVVDGGEVTDTYIKLGCTYKLEVINYESLHKVKTKPDFVILDEVHRLGAYPKPGLATRLLKSGLKDVPLIMLSGTMTPESWSQIYHILYVTNHSPFAKYKNFYKWAEEFVDIQYIFIGQQQIKDYSKARMDKIKPLIDPYMLSMTQEEAGFEEVGYTEHIHYVDLDGNIPKLIKVLMRDKVYITKDGKEILADTPAKLASKHHQLSGGTVITEDKEYKVIDTAKATFILENLSNHQLAIYYLFKSELNSILSVFGENMITFDVEEFNRTNKHFVSQVVSGREGINLSKCDHMVFYNIPYSYVSWSQTIARIQAKGKTRENHIHYIMPNLPKGLAIEPIILETVKRKEVFTSSHYKRFINL